MAFKIRSSSLWLFSTKGRSILPTKSSASLKARAAFVPGALLPVSCALPMLQKRCLQTDWAGARAALPGILDCMQLLFQPVGFLFSRTVCCTKWLKCMKAFTELKSLAPISRAQERRLGRKWDAWGHVDLCAIFSVPMNPWTTCTLYPDLRRNSALQSRSACCFSS